jgi:hypothetical protein
MIILCGSNYLRTQTLEYSTKVCSIGYKVAKLMSEIFHNIEINKTMDYRTEWSLSDSEMDF